MSQLLMIKKDIYMVRENKKEIRAEEFAFIMIKAIILFRILYCHVDSDLILSLLLTLIAL